MEMMRFRWPRWLPGGIVAVLAVWLLDLAWSARAGITLAHGRSIALAVLILSANTLFYRGRRGGERAAALAANATLFFALASGATVLSYVAATADRPLIDAALARADAAVGFDWLAWYHFVHAHPALRMVLDFCYGTLQVQIMLGVLLLPLTGYAARGREFLATIFVALLLAIALFGVFPATGAWLHFGVEAPADLNYFQQLKALRAGRMAVLRLDQLDGLITFPSFHVVGAVLAAYAARGTPVAALAVVLNLLMAVAAISDGVGGHYLMDALAGIAVAAVSIAAVRLVLRADRPLPAPRALAMQAQ